MPEGLDATVRKARADAAQKAAEKHTGTDWARARSGLPGGIAMLVGSTFERRSVEGLSAGVAGAILGRNIEYLPDLGLSYLPLDGWARPPGRPLGGKMRAVPRTRTATSSPTAGGRAAGSKTRAATSVPSLRRRASTASWP